MTVLSREANLFDFFHDEVDTAVTTTGHDVSEEGVFYLCNLLVECSHAQATLAVDTLAELHIAASHDHGTGDRGRAVHTWRRLGDQALYVSGFYPDSLSRKSVGVDYYVTMGRAVYDRLARMLGPLVARGRLVGTREDGGHKGFSEIFAELADTFEQCTDVLAEVRSTLAQRRAEVSDQELLRLYEEYLATGSPRALRQLRKLGLMATPAGSGDVSC
jgi:hypothetical protein